MEENDIPAEHENIRLLTPDDVDWPVLLNEIPQPPQRLFIEGSWPPRFVDGTAVNEDTRFLCVVGSRKHSVYGREACQALIAGLSGYNICIVSGLALGIDAIAHESALAAHLPTIAFPGSGLNPEVLYPPRNQRLAKRIIASGGTLLSEFDLDMSAMPWCFPQRNRLMAGISHAVLVIEAKLPSGTLITSRMANDDGRDVFAVPGDIFSPLSAGPHMLISKGAAIVTTSEDILHLLKIKIRDEEDEIGDSPEPNQSQLFGNGQSNQGETEEEKTLYRIISEAGGKIDKDSLIRERMALAPSNAGEINATISIMEMNGIIREENGMLKIVKNRI